MLEIKTPTLKRVNEAMLSELNDLESGVADLKVTQAKVAVCRTLQNNVKNELSARTMSIKIAAQEAKLIEHQGKVDEQKKIGNAA